MHRIKAYPNYWNHYYYTEGDCSILLERTNAGEVVYRHSIQFDYPEEAAEYFENECGA